MAIAEKRVGFTGISFPFRIGVKGGVVMSSTNEREVPHILEAMTQIIQTHFGERCMETDFYCDVDTSMFEPNEESSHTLIEYQIMDALERLEDRISVSSVTFKLSNSALYATVNFTVLVYDTPYTVEIKVGDFRAKPVSGT